MSITLVGGEKGGTGKTTLATNFAAVRALAGVDVVLVDTDQQGSAAYWIEIRNEDAPSAPRIAGVRLQGKGIPTQLQDLESRYGEVIVDAGGRDSVELRAAMTVADRMLVPIQASQFDTWTLDSMARLIAQAAALNPSLVALVTVNRASPNPRVIETEEARELINDYEELVLLNTIVRDRIAYRRAVRDGRSVVETNEDPKAAAEITGLTQEVYNDDGQ